MLKTLSNLLGGRKRILEEEINFDKAIKIIEDANSRGTTHYQTRYNLGRDNLKDSKDPEGVLGTLRDHFCPGDCYRDGEWKNRIEFSGRHEVFAIVGEEVHYLDARTTLYGGIYKAHDGGKKPHKRFWMKLKFKVPSKT
jgi:hypothetical protein